MNPSKAVEMSLYVLFQEGPFDLTIHEIAGVHEADEVVDSPRPQ